MFTFCATQPPITEYISFYETFPFTMKKNGDIKRRINIRFVFDYAKRPNWSSKHNDVVSGPIYIPHSLSLTVLILALIQ